MNKAEKERQERRRRMLAREQGHTSTGAIPGTSGDIGLRTPQPVHRSEPAAAPVPEPGKGRTTNLKSLTPLFKQRQRRRRATAVARRLQVGLGTGGKGRRRHL